MVKEKGNNPIAREVSGWIVPNSFPESESIYPEELGAIGMDKKMPLAVKPYTPDLTKKKGELEHSPWSISFSSNYLLFDIRVLNNGFRSGVLSNRTFKSTGFEQMFRVNYDVKERFKIGFQVALNTKNSQFDYAVLANVNDFNQYKNQGMLPSERLATEHQEACDLFYFESVKMKYTLQTINTGLNIQYLLVDKEKKIQLWNSVEVNSAVLSDMKVRSSNILALPQTTRSSFNEFGGWPIWHFKLSDSQ